MSLFKDRILFQDPDLLVVQKLPGELVVRGAGTVGKLPLLDFLKKDCPGLRAVHRLDFQTSGVVVFAKSKAALEVILASRFLGWKKVYRTLVVGKLKRRTGVMEMSLPARSDDQESQVQDHHVKAITHYRVLQEFRDVSYIEAEIETGRHHQIRRHFALIHHPLALDDEYGHVKWNRMFTRDFGYRKFFLHAYRLVFPHPSSSVRIDITSPIPKAFEEVLKRLEAPL